MGSHDLYLECFYTRHAMPISINNDPTDPSDRLYGAMPFGYCTIRGLHLYMNEPISNAEACKRFVKRSLEDFRLPYITITPTFSICPVHGYFSGEHYECQKCGVATKIWTRVMGYHLPVSAFYHVKKSEHAEGLFYRGGLN